MVSWISLRFSICQDFECIRNLNMLDFHWVYWQSSYYISGSEYARVLNLVWKQLWIQISRGNSKKQDMFEVHMTWKLNSFHILNSIHFLRGFGKSLRNNAPPTILSRSPPWYFLKYHQGHSLYNATHAILARTQTTLPKLARHPN